MKIEKVKSKDILESKMNEIYRKHDEEKGVNMGFKDFAYAVKNDNGDIIGGIHGWRAFNEIYIDEICIDKEARGSGIGKQLLNIVEVEINDGSCDNVNLVTNEFQSAIGFYKKCGFEVEFIRKNDKNPKCNKYYMVKKLR